MKHWSTAQLVLSCNQSWSVSIPWWRPKAQRAGQHIGPLAVKHVLKCLHEVNSHNKPFTEADPWSLSHCKTAFLDPESAPPACPTGWDALSHYQPHNHWELFFRAFSHTTGSQDNPIQIPKQHWLIGVGRKGPPATFISISFGWSGITAIKKPVCTRGEQRRQGRLWGYEKNPEFPPPGAQLL